MNNNVSGKTTSVTISGINFYKYLKFNENNVEYQIVLLGESHNNKSLCTTEGISVQQLIDGLINSTPSCVDLFIEQTPIQERGFNTSPMGRTINQFQECNLLKTRWVSQAVCNHPNLRFHLIDYRGLKNSHFVGDKLLPAILKLEKEGLLRLFSQSIEGLDINIYDEIIPYYSGLVEDFSENFDSILSLLQLPTQDYQNYRSYYKDAIKKQMDKIDEGFDKTRFLDSLVVAYSNVSIHDILLNVPMDVYFLLRFLHNYRSDRLERGPTPCHDSKYQRAVNSIVYTGFKHSSVYHLFFENYYGITHADPDFSREKCLTIKNYPSFS